MKANQGAVESSTELCVDEMWIRTETTVFWFHYGDAVYNLVFKH